MPQLNLDTRFYTDPGLYERERQAIFKRHWQMLGPAGRLQEPGSYLAVTVAGWKLFALRGQDGVLRGFHNVCRHRGARLLADGLGQCGVSCAALTITGCTSRLVHYARRLGSGTTRSSNRRNGL